MDDRRDVVEPAAREAHAWITALAKETGERVADLPDLCGGCAIAAVYLHLLLRDNGVPSKVVVGDGHCYVYAASLVVDPTSAQFGYEAPYIGPNPPNDDPTYFENHVEDDVEALVQWFEENGWPWDANKIVEHVLEPRRNREKAA
jgi:hypothetical protein